MNSNTVVVLGGSGLIGSMISRILKQYGYFVRVVDRRPAPFECEYHELDVTQPFSNTGAIFHNATAVVFALPESAAVNAIPWVTSFLSSEVVLIPTCSVQSPFYKALKAAAPQQQFAGVNPMFSPKLSVQGRTVAVCVEDTQAPQTFIERHLMEAGMKIRRMTPAAHDELMALCQALPHAAIIGFGMALAKSSVDLDTMAEVMPPPMRTMMALLSRILVNPPEVYWDIQLENNEATAQRAALVHGLECLQKNVIERDYEQFESDLQSISNALGTRLNAGAVDCQHLFSLLN
ncbi:prephenate dehydrogenase/arogenate dehydrogenase family protein [Pseudomonas palleroniana]|uniref:prephenate dehydrogenase dimerization domain-containing protein n=1 Tax=Pseudomonas palleroniana TaxID=191390 RepID=UPI001FCBEE43|nr:prephenate dehydrogenase dimerization domain-containing protein [Pseudomonas palleroniana]UOK37067.1 prephenate dehydrogenase/arogenate dehydrogenase family protein [Pseudomonas palleroniana]